MRLILTSCFTLASAFAGKQIGDSLSSSRSAFASAPLAPKRKSVVVAVIDTGIDRHHPLLREAVWQNPGETGFDSQGRDKRSNGLDDDGNGFIDDVYGWNFAGNNNDVHDVQGHGTHISGIIASKADGAFPGGLAQRSRIMALKYYDPRTPGISNLRSSVRALKYAVRMKADIINYSGGGLAPDDEEAAILREAEKKGILVIAAAGNERGNLDYKPFYPASYQLANILSVTAVDQHDHLLPSSNFGLRSVDIAAPGFGVRSTVPGKGLGLMSGTSQATAYVTGIAARLRGDRALSIAALKERVLRTARLNAQLRGKTRLSAQANPERAFSLADRGENLGGDRVENLARLNPPLFSPHAALHRLESQLAETTEIELSSRP